MEFFECNGFRFFEVEAKETNPYANGDCAANGGGYYQPRGRGYVVTRGGVMVFDFIDDSIGDYGTRYDIFFRDVISGREYDYRFGTADSHSLEGDKREAKRQRRQWHSMNVVYHIDTAELVRTIQHLTELFAYGFDSWKGSLLTKYLTSPLRKKSPKKSPTGVNVERKQS